MSCLIALMFWKSGSPPILAIPPRLPRPIRIARRRRRHRAARSLAHRSIRDLLAPAAPDAEEVSFLADNLEEAQFQRCMQAHGGKYNFIKNNCTTPPQECLPPRFGTGGSWTPNGLGQDLGNSPGLTGTKTYQGPEKTGAPLDNPALWGF